MQDKSLLNGKKYRNHPASRHIFAWFCESCASHSDRKKEYYREPRHPG